MTDDVIALSLAEEQREAARSRIVRAACAVLARRGLSATVDDVAELAGVSRRTVFRHFVSRESLFAVAIREGTDRYGQQLPKAPEGGDLRQWLVDMLTVTHQLNARNGRVFWELTGIEPGEMSPEIANAAVETRQRRNDFATKVARLVWQARGGPDDPPTWVVDTVAVHLSGFTTQCLASDLARSPDEVARVSAEVIDAAMTAALTKLQ